MGGINEKQLSSIGKKPHTGVRLHENKEKGEIHIHDDTQQIKVAIPTSQFHKLYNDWINQGMKQLQPLVFSDPSRHTSVTLTPNVLISGETDVNVTFKGPKFGPTLQKIDDFVKGK